MKATKERPVRSASPRRRAERNASTAVTITRPELEAWLDELKLPWSRVKDRAGVYMIALGPNVAVRMASTIGNDDKGVGVGEGSMHLTMVSIPGGHVVNKKAHGLKNKDSGFHRTQEWRKNWRKGFDRMHDEYTAKPDFYERIAAVADPEVNARAIAMIKAIPGWQKDDTLAYILGRAEKGEVLTQKSFDTIDERARYLTPRERPAPPPAREAPGPVRASPARDYDPRDGRVVALREVFRIARDVTGDEGAKELARTLANQIRDGVATDDRQLRAVRALVAEYGIPFAYPTDEEYNAAMGPPQRRAATNGRRARVKAKGRVRARR